MDEGRRLTRGRMPATVGWKNARSLRSGEKGGKTMKRALLITIVLCLLPDVVKAQWTFDVVSAEAYINDHKKQRVACCWPEALLSTANKLLHEYSRREVGEYKGTEYRPLTGTPVPLMSLM